MKLEAIHKTLFRNLLGGGLFIAVIAGVLITLIELKSIDRQLSKISSAESGKISKYYENFYDNRTDESLVKLNNFIRMSLDHDLFIFIEFLDDRLKRVTQISIKDYKSINSHLNDKFGNFKMTGKYEHKTAFYNGQLFIKIMVPVFSEKTGIKIGHFQGIYHLADTKLNEIIWKSFYSILLTMFTVLITTVLIYPIILKLNKKLISLSYDLLTSNTNILKSLGSAIAERDSDTNSHNYRVTIYSVKLAETIGCSASQIRDLIKGAFLHDVGKIGISDNILLKPGKLTEEEFEIMKQHVAIGAKIIKHNDWLKKATDVIQYHHEKYDGSGYLKGMKGIDIPMNAKIFAISDVFDALTSERPYKKPFSYEKSMSIMEKDSGKHFDPELFNIFQEIADQIYTKVHSIKSEEELNNYLNTIVSQYFMLRV